MAKVTPGFKLYLYQLLSHKIGTGKQTLLPQVEEALKADDILPEDLECASVQEVVEACPDFLKLTVFKKGRTYVTVLANDEWDAMLAAPVEKEPNKGKPKGGKGGPKTWKKKKSAKKILKPVKPGKKRRDREAAEALEAAERAAEEARIAAELAAARALEDDEREIEVTAEGDTAAQETADGAPPVEEAEPQDTLTPQDQSSPDTTPAAPEAEQGPDARADQPAGESADANSGQTAEPEPAPIPAAQAPAEPPAPEPEPEPEPEPAPIPTTPAAPEPSPISLTITYDPYEDMERELARQAAEASERAKARQPEVSQKIPQPEPEPEPYAQTPARLAQADLPQSMHTEVACKDALLRALYQLLPYEVEPMAVLDEDWRVARSTGEVSGTRNRVSFPLHYLHEDGTPITVTLRKTSRNVSGKRWSLALVDGDDGSGSSHDTVGFEGLPAADEGAWSDLSGAAPSGFQSPSRELAQEVAIGSWDSFLGSLANIAAPERWNYPGEGVGHQSRYGILREYITISYHRARCQELIAQSADGSSAAFNTGLLTAFGEDVYCYLTARKGDIPWQFAGFATAGSGELGARLAGTIAPLPDPPSYLADIESVVADQKRMVILDLEAVLTRQLGRLPRAFLAERLEGNAAAREILDTGTALSADDLTHLSRVIRQDGSSYRRMRRALDDAISQAMRSLRASYRLATPVYDPAENRTKLLVPLCLVEDGRADCALVLDLQPSGAYRAAAIVPLPRAYACARVISREQPTWLAASRVL